MPNAIIILLSAGWSLFSYSSATPINVTHLNFTNSTATVNWTKAVSQGKVLAYFYYRDNNNYRYSATPDFGMQDYALRQNRSYWVKVNEVCNSSQPCNLSMLGVGGSLAGRSYLWRNLRFTNGSDEKNITDAYAENWTDQEVYYYNVSIGDFEDIPSFGATLNSWDYPNGYFIWVKQSNVQLLRRN